jgi:hypothetical protein
LACGCREGAYELRTTPTVRRVLGATPPEAVATAAYEFITRPRGTYRVIYRIDDKARVVTVVDVAHRRDVYRT